MKATAGPWKMVQDLASYCSCLASTPTFNSFASAPVGFSLCPLWHSVPNMYNSLWQMCAETGESGETVNKPHHHPCHTQSLDRPSICPGALHARCTSHTSTRPWGYWAHCGTKIWQQCQLLWSFQHLGPCQQWDHCSSEGSENQFTHTH